MKKNIFAGLLLLSLVFVPQLFAQTPLYTVPTGQTTPTNYVERSSANTPGQSAPTNYVEMSSANPASPRSTPAGSAPCVTNARDGFCMLENPTRITSIQALIQTIFQLFIYVAYFICAFFIILTGFKFVTAQGNSDKVGEAGKQLTNVLIGTAIILGLDIILRLIFRTIQSVLQ
jgi:hypothetical protein